MAKPRVRHSGKGKHRREMTARAARSVEGGRDSSPILAERLDEREDELWPRRDAPVAETREHEEAALLAAIAESPDDDGPRLVYADLLAERGDNERAELIQMQLERARTGKWPPSRREGALIAANAEQWLAPILPVVQKRSWTFVRGFLESVTLVARRRGVLRSVVGHPLWATVRRASVTADGDVSAILVDPVLRNLIAVDVRRSPSTLRSLLGSDAAIRELHGLFLPDIRNDRALLAALVECRGLPRLETVVVAPGGQLPDRSTAFWTHGLDRPGMRLIIHEPAERFAPWWILALNVPPRHASVIVSSPSTETRLVGRTLEVTVPGPADVGVRELAVALGVIPTPAVNDFTYAMRVADISLQRITLRIAPRWQALPLVIDRPPCSTLGQLVEVISARLRSAGTAVQVEEGRWTPTTTG